MSFSSVPQDVLDELAELEAELKDGDITQKGYEKRRAKVLEPYGGESALKRPAVARALEGQLGSPRPASPAGGKAPMVKSFSSLDDPSSIQKAKAKSKVNKALPALLDDEDDSDSSPMASPIVRTYSAGSGGRTDFAMSSSPLSTSAPAPPPMPANLAYGGPSSAPHSGSGISNGGNSPAPGAGAGLVSNRIDTNLLNSALSKSAANNAMLQNMQQNHTANAALPKPNDSTYAPISRVGPVSNSSSSNTNTNNNNNSPYAQPNKNNSSLSIPQQAALKRKSHYLPNVDYESLSSVLANRNNQPAVTTAAPSSTAAAAAAAPATTSAASSSSSGRQDNSSFYEVVNRQQILASIQAAGPLPSPTAGQATSSSGSSITPAAEDGSAPASGFSSRIQQLVSALREPSQAPKQKFFAKQKDTPRRDATAPKPTGDILLPVSGVAEQLPMDPARITDLNPISSLAEVLKWRSTSQAKKLVYCQFDHNGKMMCKISYGGLCERALSIMDSLMNRHGAVVGDRVALVFRREDSIDFASALFGCIYGGFVAVPFVLPKKAEDSSVAQIAFLLNSSGVKLALTNEATKKFMPRDNQGRLCRYKSWPGLEYISITNFSKVPAKRARDPIRLAPLQPAIIEASTTTANDVKPVFIGHKALVEHCSAVSEAMLLTSTTILFTTLDSHYGIGLHYALLTTVFTGMTTFIMPFSEFALQPVSLWNVLTRHKVNIALLSYPSLAFSTSRVGEKEKKKINLSPLRALYIDTERTSPDLSRKFCDAFKISTNIISPIFFSAEALTVAIRSPLSQALLLNIDLKMAGYEVVRPLPAETRGGVMFIQDSGFVIPRGKVVIVSPEAGAGEAQVSTVCLTDQIGEICLSAPTTALGFYGLEGRTAKVFKVRPLRPSGQNIDQNDYVRTGWLGFFSQGRLFVTGNTSSLITSTQSNTQINPDDIKKLILSVQPTAVFNERLAVFSMEILNEPRIVIAFETDKAINDSMNKWTRLACDQVENESGNSVYAVCFCKVGSLPISPEGELDLFKIKKSFTSGTLYPLSVVMNMISVSNIPKAGPRLHDGMRMMADAVQGVQLSDTAGVEHGNSLAVDDSTMTNLDNFKTISELLRWRAVETPNNPIFTSLDETTGKEGRVYNCLQFHQRILRYARFIEDKLQLNSGDSVAILLPPGIEFVCAIYGCMYTGVIAVPIRPPFAYNVRFAVPTLRRIVSMSKARAILTTEAIFKILRSRDSGIERMSELPPVHTAEDIPKRQDELVNYYRPPTTEMLALIEFNISSTGLLAGVRVTHDVIMSVCRSQKVFHQYHSSSPLLAAIDPYSGLGLYYWAFVGVYNGHLTIGCAPSEVIKNISLLFAALTNLRIKNSVTTYPIIQRAVEEYAGKGGPERMKGFDLTSLTRLIVDCVERPRASMQALFTNAFMSVGLSNAVFDNAFNCEVNAAISMRTRASREPMACYVDLVSLRQDRVELVERGSPNSVCIYSSGKALPKVKIAIVNPDNAKLCSQKQVGEIWVAGQNNNKGYTGLDASINDAVSQEQFYARIQNGQEAYARTGLLGFLHESELFVCGDIEETLMVNGYRLYPIDIEQSVEKATKHVDLDGSAVFLASELLIVVAEIENQLEIPNIIPLLTNVVLDEHAVIVHAIAFVEKNTIPKNSRGQKQRIRLRDGFLKGILNPIHIAYNVIERSQ